MEELRHVVMAKSTPRPTGEDPRANAMGLRLGHNVCYVVGMVLMHEGKVLLIQEAKASCRGSWYLPAGRVEPNETLETAIRREVLEETGLRCEPEAVIAVECRAGQWIRFTYIGHILGGSLKTPDAADKDSIQAVWFSPKCLPPLRCYDIVLLMEQASKWYSERTSCRMILTTPVGHTSSSIRIVAVHRSRKEGMNVLTLKSMLGTTSYPVICPLAHDPSDTVIKVTLKAYGYEGTVEVKGVLSLEHLGSDSLDGLCLSLLVELASNRIDPLSRCKWVPVKPRIAERLEEILDNGLCCTKLIGI